VALWLVGRSWFSPRAGLAAAALVAISPFHIVYSAAALTDVWLGLWLLLAVDAAGRSLARRDLRWAVAAGLYTGFAWWTKYNGWLPLAIEGAGLGVLAAVSRLHPGMKVRGSGVSVQDLESDVPVSRGRRRVGARNTQPAVASAGEKEQGNWSWLWPAVGCLAMTSVVALLAWSPYWFALQKVGGYGPIAGNHAKYVVGFAGWLTSAARQVAGFSVIDRGFTAAGILAAFVVPAFSVTAETNRGSGTMSSMAIAWPIIAGALVSSVSFLTAPLLSLASLSALGLIVLSRRLWAAQQTAAHAPQAVIGSALLIVWWGGLFVATPCYWPYPRLLLPWLLAACLALGVLVDELCEGSSADESSAESAGLQHLFRTTWRWSAAAVGVLFATLPLAMYCRPAAGIAQNMARDRLGVERVARHMHIDLDQGAPGNASPAASDNPSRVVYVLGEPPLLFQLAAAGEAFVRPVEQLPTSAALYSGQPMPTFLAVGPHAAQDHSYQTAWPAHASHWRLVGEYPYEPSAIVWLDLHNPLSTRDAGASGDHVFRLYELKPPASPTAADGRRSD
jgi:dolichyl-phosphate-mannose-protein mannosyltransferase